MAASPMWKIYDQDRNYVAACKELEACAALMVFYGPGSTIRLGHGRVVYTEGSTIFASESYDAVVGSILSQKEA